jgi:hypothetical protein
MGTTTIADAACAYAKRGWKPVPVNRKSKKVIGNGWQKRPFAPEQFNGNSINVGIQFGKVSGGLCDVDLDSQLAIGLAQEFLPKTDAIFGHRSKPDSHQLYISDLHETEQRAAIQFPDCSGAMIVELRIGAGDKGAASIVPPSMHVTGEMVRWTYDGDHNPARVSGPDLKRAVLELAVVCLLHPYYPVQGSRHNGALALGGVLARASWSADAIKHVIEVLARHSGDHEIADRVEAAASAVGAKSNGHDVAGLTSFAELWGEDVAKRLGKWLALRSGKAGNGGGPEDDVALAFAAQHADQFRYVAASSQWMRWNVSRWMPEQTLAAFDEARTLCRQAGDADAKVVAAVERLAKTDRRIAATTEQWDADPEMINTPTTESST